jgi:hypothetical protein
MYNSDLGDLANQIGMPADNLANTQNAVAKALTTGSGFVGINLESPASLLMPFVTLLRNRLPVDRPPMGAKEATWRTQFGFGSYDFAAGMGTQEAATGSTAGGTATTYAASYITQAVTQSVSLQAIKASEGYDDQLQIGVMQALATLLRQDELNTLGGNRVALAAPATVTCTPGGSGSLTPYASYKVTALTLQGCIANTAANCTTTQTDSTGAAISGSYIGESTATAGNCATTGSKAYVNIVWTPVQGALGYKIYGGGSGSEKLMPLTAVYYTPTSGTSTAIYVPQTSTQSFVTVDSCQIQTTTALTAAFPSADGTVNLLMQEGILSWAQKNTIYGQALPTGCNQQTYDCGGLALTVGSDGITEFDAILRPLWQTWKTSPTFIIGSPASISSVSGKLMSVGTANYRIDISAERGRFVGGMFAGGYLNKYVANVLTGMPDVIPLLAHPDMIDGTFLFLSEKIPYQYAREARAWALDVQLPYTYFDLARSTVAFPFSVLCIETLKCYHPSAQGCIVGARV